MFEGLDQTFLKNNDEWVQSYNSVDWNDITTIDKLVVGTEALVQKYNNPNEHVKSNIYKVFDELLGRYPLFFGYWKRYVAVKYQLDGLEGSISTLKASLHSFPTSIDLWIDMLNVYLTHNQNDSELIRNQFRKCESLVGSHFLSHDIWDKHIAYETRLQNWENVFEVYKQVMQQPLHQYARYYTSFKEFLEYHPEFANRESSIHLDTTFISNQEKVNKIWTYESQIKQPFFNIPELPENEIQNWDAYLSFLINNTEFSTELIKSTFERCLIPCLRYEYFWGAYIDWTERTFGPECTFPLFERALRALPADNKSFKQKYIKYLESNMDPYNKLSSKHYMDALYTFQLKWPHDPSSTIKYLRFHKRRYFAASLNDEDKKILEQQSKYATFLDKTIKAYLSGNADTENHDISQQLLAMLNDTTLPILVVELIKVHWLVLKNVIQCRKHFTYFAKLDPIKTSVLFWLTYYKFEKTQKNIARLTKFVDQLGTEIVLPTKVINDIVRDFQGFYLINADYSEYETNLSQSRFGFDPIVHNRFKINNPTWRPNAKLTKDWYKSEKYRSNGHPGLFIDKPQIKNTIIETLASKQLNPAPLPTFRNLEKIHQKPKFDDYMSIDYLK
ncbi:Prp39p [Kluyveromyces lactis]|uniref:KLLA0A08019p n=1 Tax=Kluyveromyces lactis (strain ATCC 8585 / CBS 2359 / DSM 70799 / NBRC 1267 / NRRL Y-1140 / WM37) TaxID=284590 RepID=Q6CXI2_KLULA|nr:uncharacterized protein KLLA0_A08019g [Kluyveromyces lactis]CAH02945.1 KLLA0A08019p [Kluyveromyces lactis]|eukprot:XP_451357.1 uncharacterized protein KLLA0_A08019g [Kluyveromyces lactis]